jgi:hypothetical protein
MISYYGSTKGASNYSITLVSYQIVSRYWGRTEHPMFELQALEHILEMTSFFMMDDGQIGILLKLKPVDWQ